MESAWEKMKKLNSEHSQDTSNEQRSFHRKHHMTSHAGVNVRVIDLPTYHMRGQSPTAVFLQYEYMFEHSHPSSLTPRLKAEYQKKACSAHDLGAFIALPLSVVRVL